MTSQVQFLHPDEGLIVIEETNALAEEPLGMTAEEEAAQAVQATVTTVSRAVRKKAQKPVGRTGEEEGDDGGDMDMAMD